MWGRCMEEDGMLLRAHPAILIGLPRNEIPTPFAKQTVFSPNLKQRAKTYLMNRIDDPIDSRIPPDGLMLRIHQYHLEVFVSRVLIDPI